MKKDCPEQIDLLFASSISFIEKYDPSAFPK